MRTESRVLLISSHTKADLFSNIHRPVADLGIRTLAAWLNHHELPTEIIPSHLQSEEETINKLRNDTSIKILGISINISGSVFGLKVARLAKKVRPDVKIVLGGYFPTFGYKEILSQRKEVDFIVRGEGEIPLLRLCQFILGSNQIPLKEIPNISYRLNDEVVINNVDHPPIQNLDIIPRPLRTLPDMPKDCTDIMISTSRGCYGRCHFCSVAAFNGSSDNNSWRSKNLELVIDEVEEVVSNFKAKFIHFVDDSFFGPTKTIERCEQFRNLILNRKLNIQFLISSRANDIRRDCIKLLKECGLAAVHLGIESFSKRQLSNVYNKGIDPITNMAAIDILQDENIHTQLGLILFEPSVELDDLEINCSSILKTGEAVVKGNDSSLFCASGTHLAHALINSKKSLGTEFIINHIWPFDNTNAEVVYRHVSDFNARYPNLGNSLIEILSPPYYYPIPIVHKVKELYIRYKQASFLLLKHVINMVRLEVSSGQISTDLATNYNDIFAEIEISLYQITSKFSATVKMK